jgi:histidinol-phosphate aminotransferase
MIDLDKIVRKNVKDLIPYSCARDEFQGNAAIFMDANENPYGSLNRYPDPYQMKLKLEISALRNIPAERIFLGNGSDEIIDLCFRVFCNPGTDKALTFSPTYGMYQVSAAANDITIIKVPLSSSFQIDLKDVMPWLSDKSLKIILVCSPNNPTGNCMNRNTLEKIITGFDGIVLLDEAYNDFADEPSFRDQTDRYPNLIVMQTFSKAFGLASVRVGIAFTNPRIVSYFNKIKPPYNISMINQKAVLQKLLKPDEYMEQVRKIREGRLMLSEELIKLPVIEKVYPSDANFLLVKVRDSGELYNYLAGRGIIVRNRDRLVSNCLRITIGTEEENRELLKTLKSFET